MNLRVFGPPGTGKTFTLQRIVFHLIGDADVSNMLGVYNVELPHDKYRLKDIIYISYTNSAVDELLGRIGVTRNYRRGMWGTMHGITLHLLIKNRKIRSDIVSKTFSRPGGPNWWKRKFTSEVGLPYDPTGEKINLPGNQLFSAYTRYINTYYPKFMDLERVLDKLTNETEYGYYADDWVKFKIDNGVIDFDDVLMLGYISGVSPEGQVLISDEFQDYSPIQWAIFSNWMLDRDEVIVAGDDDQVLYSFHGASPRFILYDFPADHTIVLRQSFRLPAKILAYSRLLSETYIKHRYPKRFEPRVSGGIVTLFPRPLTDLPKYAYELAKRGKRVLILARTNSQVSNIEELFMFRSVPFYRFKSKKVTIWEDFVDRIVEVLQMLKSGSPIPINDAKFFLKFTGIPHDKIDIMASKLADSRQRSLDSYRILKDPLKYIKFPRVKEYFGSERLARLALNSLKAAIKFKMNTIPGKVYIDTIHAAKGREGDIVFVLDHISNKIQDEIYVDDEAFEAEMRVWYVAMTRARETLAIVSGDNTFLWPHLTRALMKLKSTVKVRRL